MVVLIFLNFFYYFFGIFYYALGRKETERQDLFSFFVNLFQPILAVNEAKTVFFNFFLIFLLFFWIFLLRIGQERYGTT